MGFDLKPLSLISFKKECTSHSDLVVPQWAIRRSLCGGIKAWCCFQRWARHLDNVSILPLKGLARSQAESRVEIYKGNKTEVFDDGQLLNYYVTQHFCIMQGNRQTFRLGDVNRNVRDYRTTFLAKTSFLSLLSSVSVLRPEELMGG